MKREISGEFRNLFWFNCPSSPHCTIVMMLSEFCEKKSLDFGWKDPSGALCAKGTFHWVEKRCFCIFCFKRARGVCWVGNLCTLQYIKEGRRPLTKLVTGNVVLQFLPSNFRGEVLEGAKKKCLHFSSHFREVQKELWIGLSRCVPGFFSYRGWKRPQIF